jgi:transcription termination/antitermination protein NusA
MSADLIRFVDSISRDKNIDRESVFADLETAMVSAVRKSDELVEDVVVRIDRGSGAIEAVADGKPIDMRTLGRIAAQTAKQVMIQKIREDERSSIFEEFSERVGTVVTGQVVRYESGGLVVNVGRAEAFMPRSETIPGGSHHPGERVRGMILDVREEQSQVRIVLSQTHPDYIRKLFEMEVPEVAERIIEIRALAREAGYRTKIAVSSIDSKVDAVGACVGVRGSRIRNIVDELGGEKIDIVRWNESSQILIANALKPAEIKETFLCFELGKATVVVDEEQLSLAIGKRGQNVRLAARLTGWDIDIMTPAEYDRSVDYMEKALKAIEGVEDVTLDKMLALGIVSLEDLAEVGPEPLVGEFEMDEALAKRICEVAEVEGQRVAKEEAARKAADAERRAADRAALESVGEGTDGQGEVVAAATAEQDSNVETAPSEADEGALLRGQSGSDDEPRNDPQMEPSSTEA